MELRHGRVAARGLDFPTLEAGPADGPLALCLHGFPDTPRTWRLLLPELARAGFRAVAPALRGYAPSALPADGVYHLAAVARDALALADALGHQRFALIGHDWGAAAAHAAAAFAPQRIARLVTMAVPHQRLPEALLTSYDQQRRSFYIFLFQLPFADSIVAMHDFAFLERLWRDWSPGYRLPSSELEELKKVFRQPGVLQAALGYYRSVFVPPPPELAGDAALLAGSVPVPALYFHGLDDGCVGAEVCRGLEAGFPKGVRAVMVEGAGHFLHLEQPELVSREVLAHLGRPELV